MINLALTYSFGIQDNGTSGIFSPLTGRSRGAVVIFNPFAGKLARNGSASLTDAEQVLTATGHTVKMIPTQGPGTAGAIARESLAQGVDLILAAGGDGTINEVLQGIAGTNAVFGALPAGTANVLTTEMGIGTKMDLAVRQASQWVPKRISVGRLTSAGSARYFLLMAGIGLDAHVVYHLSADLKSRFGKGAYWTGALKVLGRELEEFQVETGGRQYTCSFALASKVRNYGGDFQIASNTSLLEDRFELVLFEGRSSLRYLRYLAGVARRKLDGIKGVTVLRAAEMNVSSAGGARVYVQVDGEFAGCLPARLEIVPDALTLLMPPSYIERHQGQ
jgi:diacylglycerol kinase (ATP)